MTYSNVIICCLNWKETLVLSKTGVKIQLTFCIILQGGAPKIAKLPYKCLNYGLW